MGSQSLLRNKASKEKKVVNTAPGCKYKHALPMTLEIRTGQVGMLNFASAILIWARKEHSGPLLCIKRSIKGCGMTALAIETSTAIPESLACVSQTPPAPPSTPEAENQEAAPAKGCAGTANSGNPAALSNEEGLAWKKE